MADIKTELRQAAVDAFNTFDSVAERVVYNQVITSFEKDSNKVVVTNKKVNVKAIFMAINKEQHVLVDLVTGDMIVLLAGPNTKFVPELWDTIIRNKDTYNVVGIANDSVGAVIKLQVRL